MSYDCAWQGWLSVLGGGGCCCTLPLAASCVCRTGDGLRFGTARELHTWVCHPSPPKVCSAVLGVGAAAAPSPRGRLSIVVHKSSL